MRIDEQHLATKITPRRNLSPISYNNINTSLHFSEGGINF